MSLTKPTDHIELQPDEPCVFYSYHGQAWYEEPVGKLLREKNALRFDCYNHDTEKIDSFVRMVIEADGLFHRREVAGIGHW